MRGADDDVGDRGRDADLDAGVTLLSELALEELVELGVENTVCGGESAMHDDDSHISMCAVSGPRVQCLILPEPPVPMIAIIVPARLQGSHTLASPLLQFSSRARIRAYRTGDELSPLGAAGMLAYALCGTAFSIGHSHSTLLRSHIVG